MERRGHHSDSATTWQHGQCTQSVPNTNKHVLMASEAGRTQPTWVELAALSWLQERTGRLKPLCFELQGFHILSSRFHVDVPQALESFGNMHWTLTTQAASLQCHPLYFRALHFSSGPLPTSYGVSFCQNTRCLLQNPPSHPAQRHENGLSQLLFRGLNHPPTWCPWITPHCSQANFLVP